MNVENNHTAETEREQTDHGNNIITLQTTLGDEDEDVHKCGRCQSEFSTLETFIQHKLHQTCKRPPESQVQGATPQVDEPEDSETERNDPVVIMVEGSSADEADKTNSLEKSEVLLGRGRRKRVVSAKAIDQSAKTDDQLSDSAVNIKTAFKANQEGRYICQLCKKTFKTTNILRTHMNTHSDHKDFPCELCGTAFRTKGSLIRHIRRHTDERPYRCTLCGLSFRESGALTRHLKSITPCTEKIRFSHFKEILISKDGIQKGVEEAPAPLATQEEAMELLQQQQQQQQQQQEEEEEVEEAQAAVVSMVEAGSEEVIHQVHFTMEVDKEVPEQQVVVEQSQVEATGPPAVGDNLICQAIINSGIALETEEQGVVEQVTEEVPQAAEETPKEVYHCSDAEGRLTEIEVTEEYVGVEAEELEESSDGNDSQSSPKLHQCPHCSRSFKGLNYLRFHVKGHLGYKPFKCTLCHKEFLTGYLLKKHMEAHVSERRYKCGECGKLYKTIGHVREHMRAHSDERPFHCNSCNKGYKTKNALQVHQRTHGQEKPYVCLYCARGFREKGSLIRHIRHHTGEKPYKCPNCQRGFAEHGTLNRHMRAKGGCQKSLSMDQQPVLSEEQESTDSLGTAAIIAEDPHAVLVEFSSVVADTQEYIIGTTAEGTAQEGAVTLIQDSQNQMGDHIMKVVQQIVSQSRSAGGMGSPQIIVRNVAMDEVGASISDCGDTITIATPESLTEQVAMTLASAISDGTLLAAAGAVEAEDGTVTMVRTTEGAMEEDIQTMQQQEEYVITSTEEVEIQTVVV